jgi:hypothetical protein
LKLRRFSGLSFSNPRARVQRTFLTAVGLVLGIVFGDLTLSNTMSGTFKGPYPPPFALRQPLITARGVKV